MSDGVIVQPEAAEPPDSWQYPFDFDAALTIEPAAGQPGWICRPERIFAGATPAWGLSQSDVDAARSMVNNRDAGATGSTTPPRGSAAFRSSSDQGSSTDQDVADPTPTPTDQAVNLAADRAEPDASSADGVAEAFVDLLRHEVVPPVPGFRIIRLVPPPEARGERPIAPQDPHERVVVGERVVVTWVRQVLDADHAAPRTLAHLDAVDFFGVPETHGILLWTTPSGREVPVAWATKYLPRAKDGWDWCVDLAQRSLGLDAGGPRDAWVEDFPARLGRLAAKLHVALATPSRVLPEPTGLAGADLVRAGHGVATETVERAAAVARAGTLEGVADVLLPRLESLTAAVDGLLAVVQDVESATGGVVVQQVHGDLHVGQVLRWPGGLAVIDFHPEPTLEFRELTVGQPLAPAARDLARLLRSIDHVGRIADKGSGFTSTHDVDRWSHAARSQLLDAYRAELASCNRSDLLDERLLAPFEAEQLCREIVYASEQLPSWAYAPLGGLWQEFARVEAGPRASSERGRHATVASVSIPTSLR